MTPIPHVDGMEHTMISGFVSECLTPFFNDIQTWSDRFVDLIRKRTPGTCGSEISMALASERNLLQPYSSSKQIDRHRAIHGRVIKFIIERIQGTKEEQEDLVRQLFATMFSTYDFDEDSVFDSFICKIEALKTSRSGYFPIQRLIYCKLLGSSSFYHEIYELARLCHIRKYLSKRRRRLNFPLGESLFIYAILCNYVVGDLNTEEFRL